MNKNILAVAIAAAVAAPSAFAAATVYGNAHMSVNATSSVANGSNVSADQTAVSSNSSYFGVKGSEDLAGGLKAVYQIETGVGLDGEGSNTLGSNLRNSFAGIGGGFGTVLLGRHDSPMKMVGRKYDLFGDQVGNNRNILGGGLTPASALVDGRHSNVIAYASPTMNGFSALVAYVPGSVGGLTLATATNNGNELFSTADQRGDAYSAMLDYTAGNLSVTGGYIGVNTKGGTLGGVKDFSGYRLGAGYTFGAAKVVALAQQTNVYRVLGVAADQTIYGLGASYELGNGGKVKGQYYVAGDVKNQDVGGSMLTVGYDHALSKSTTAYVAYAMAQNDNNGSFTTAMSNGGVGETYTAVGAGSSAGNAKDNSVVSVGLQHKF